MGLADIQGSKCFDVLADIMEPTLKIAQDEDVKALFSLNKERPEGMSAEEFGVKLMSEKFPGMIKKHKKELTKILAALNGTSEKEYLKDLTFPKLVNDVYGLMQDQSFRAFLS